MGQATKIQWTDRTWNPVRGCSRVSEGCRSCYAERLAGRFAGPGLPFDGFVTLHRRREERDVVGRDGSIRQQVSTTSEARWTSKVELVPSHLPEPLSWRKPQRVFVNSMSDLFHEGLSNEDIAAVFGVMAACPEHQFQVLTKRPARARDWFRWIAAAPGLSPPPGICAWSARAYLLNANQPVPPALDEEADGDDARWPLPNVWLGCSVEDQATADERIPLLLDTPAALRFVSAEPLLGPVDLRPYLQPMHGAIVRNPPEGDAFFEQLGRQLSHEAALLVPRGCDVQVIPGVGLDWVIAGGESGPGARPCAIEWIEGVVEQCAAARVPAFVKQLGAKVVSVDRVDAAGRWAWQAGLTDRKGGDPTSWPPEVRVREFPASPASILPVKSAATSVGGEKSEVTPGV